MVEKILKTSLLICTALVLLSCSKSLETTFNTQESNIDKLITSMEKDFPDMVTTINNNSYRLTIVPGSGPQLLENGTVSFHYAGYIFSGSSLPGESNLFATNKKSIIDTGKWNLTETDTTALTVNIAQDEIVTGLRNGLKGIQEGEECYIVFSGKYGFGKKPYGTIPANSALLYHIWAGKVTNE
ncbi:MAG: FKBP-type peptidyl-prolyl cis-trans isomerase [Candidatus Cryptobacteroides sp.]